MTVGYLDIKPVVKPQELAVLPQTYNGKLPSDMLVTVGPRGMLHRCAARAYMALAFKCLGIGLPLTYTYGGTYRSYADQEWLFRSRYSPTGQYGGCKMWNDVRWCKILVNGKVPAGAAVPGTSNHGWGLAIDTAFDIDPGDGIGPDDAAAITGHPQWPKFKEFVLDCGFSWEDSSEPWHIRFVMGDTVPQAVLDVENFIADHLNPPAPVPPIVTVEDDMLRSTEPFRVVDTRNSSDPMAAGGTRLIPLGLDANTVRAEVNITTLNGAEKGYVTVWGGGPLPTSSTLPIKPGEVTSNAVTVPVVDGKISVFASKACDIIVDLTGASWVSA